MNVSVIICTYNRCESLKDTLDSLLTQECNDSLDYEIIVIDNNSKDKTRGVTESYISKFDGGVKYVIELKQGLSYARNKGIKESKGDIIAFIDDDVKLTKNWLMVTKEVFEKFDCVGIGGKVLPLWPSKPPSWFQLEGKFKMWGGISFLDLGKDIKEFDGVFYSPMGANMAFRKETFERYGLFNINLGRKGDNLIGAEELDFCNRLLKNKERLIYCPESIVYHVVDNNRLSLNYCRKFYFDQGRTISKLNQYPKGIVRYLNIPRYLFKQLLENIFDWVHSIIKNERKEIILFYEFKIRRVCGEIYGNLLGMNSYKKQRVEKK